MRRRKKGRKFHFVNEVGGKKIGTDEQDRDFGRGECSRDACTPVVAGLDVGIVPKLDEACTFEGFQMDLQTLQVLSVFMAIADKDLGSRQAFSMLAADSRPLQTDSMTTPVEVREIPVKQLLVKKTTCGHNEIGLAFGKTIHAVGECFRASGAEMTSMPMAVYLAWRESDCHLAVGCQAKGDVTLMDGWVRR